jgi:hypothetical protein
MVTPIALISAMRSHGDCLQAEVTLKVEEVALPVFVPVWESASNPYALASRVGSGGESR